jgi:hypothetical protein
MPTPFDSDIDLWLCALRAAGRSPVTLAGYRHTWGHFLTLDRPPCDRLHAAGRPCLVGRGEMRHLLRR